jgi:TP901 family phage tail tape measure protein
VFLRAGNDQQDVIYGVAASLMAARIAQLNITDSTNMLVSAMRQFRLETKEIIPTLDTLNELSNNYKVTTNDLMQAIGRTGSVFSAHNGTIAELASMTAVIAQRTSRTGAEVGNALKTIESRLDRTDSARKVFDKLAVSTRDFDGEARSLAKTIFELSLRMNDLDATDAQQLRIDIAGIRQVNFLVSALSEAESQVIAMQRALINNNSAYSEFLESSLTLESSLERLKAHITSIAQGVRGPLGQMFTGLTNTVGMIISLISNTAKFTIVGPAVIAAFWMLRQVIQRLTASISETAANFMKMGATTSDAAWRMGLFNMQAKSTIMHLKMLAAGQTKWTIAKKLSIATLGGLKGAMLPFLTVGNLATLAIGGMITTWTLSA